MRVSHRSVGRTRCLVVILLFIWFFVSFGLSILFKEKLDSITFGGFKLGFWFAQQGSMYVFVIFSLHRCEASKTSEIRR